MSNKTILLFIFSLYSISTLFAESFWKEDSVYFSGKILNYDKQNGKTISIQSIDVIKRNLQQVHVAEINESGHFSISISIFYPQDLYFIYGFSSSLICAPGDKMVLEIDAHAKRVNVVSGSRIQDNAHYGRFIYGISGLDIKKGFEMAKTSTAIEFIQYVKQKAEDKQQFFNAFKHDNNTSVFFNLMANDFLKYDMWVDLMCYREWFAAQNNIKKSEIELPAGYFDFLEQYQMDDNNQISSLHADFLHQLGRYVLSVPSDSLKKAEVLFQNQKEIDGGKVLMNMILTNSTGFTQELLLTKLYLDAIEGKQLDLFNALFDSSLVTDDCFRSRIAKEHKKLQMFLTNQNTDGSTIFSIKSNIVKDLIDTITTKYSGKVIYVDFWAPWCAPCMAEMPNSKSLQQDFKNQDVVFLFLANRCGEDSWKATIANKGITGEHILLNNDQYAVLAGEFGITGIPHYVLIGKDGRIVSKNALRPSQKEQLKGLINRLLNN